MNEQTITETESHPVGRCPNCETVVEVDEKECPNCQTLLFFEPSTSAEKLGQRLKSINRSSFTTLLLREKEFLFESIFRGEKLDQILKQFLGFTIAAAALYGLLIGFYSGGWQIISSAIKVPVLLLGSLLVCLPALYTLNVLIGARLTFKQTLAVILTSTYMIGIVLVSMAPIMFFFIVSAGTRDFVNFLNILIFGSAGIFGLSMLWKGMRYLSHKSGFRPNRSMIAGWTILYVFVGTQLAWSLRPFVGSSGEFLLFRELEGNFYIAVTKMLASLLGANFPNF